jgi:hypothetical protein
VDQLAYSSVILKPTQVQLLAQDGGALPRRSADKGWRGRRSRALCDNNARPAGRTVSDSRLADNDVAQHSGELFDSYTKLLDFFLRVTIGLWLDWLHDAVKSDGPVAQLWHTCCLKAAPIGACRHM